MLKSVTTVASLYGIPVVGPNMAVASADTASITAFDPIKNATITYTGMEDFVALGVHVYDNAGGLDYWARTITYLEYGRPVWVTEYANFNVADITAARDNLILATDYMERSSFITAYAWFKERSKNADDTLVTSISLLSLTSGVLTTLGQYYIAVPVHDSDLYYRLPGRLPAENYVTMSGCSLRATTDTDGTFDLTMSSGATADYNVLIETAGTYTVKVRAAGSGAGTGTVQLRENGATLASANTTGTAWQTVTMSVTLPAGPQVLQLRRGTAIAALNWVEFSLP
jgi:hypothetical protein